MIINKKNSLSVLFCVCILILILISFSSCSLPNTVSNYLDKVNNNGNLSQILNDRANYSYKNNLTQDNNRLSYPNLNDQEFANFIDIDALGIKNSILFRSASPINSNSERAKYADKFMMLNNIKNVINLEDDETQACKYNNFNNTYYSKQNILYAPINNDYSSQQTKDSIKKIVDFINNNEFPILIHCNDGAERTGIICALLQCLNTAGYDYVKANYIKAFQNLYIHDSNITDLLDMQFRNEFSKTIGLTNHNIIYTNLNKYTKKYLESCGINKSDIDKLSEKIRKVK